MEKLTLQAIENQLVNPNLGEVIDFLLIFSDRKNQIKSVVNSTTAKDKLKSFLEYELRLLLQKPEIYDGNPSGIKAYRSENYEVHEPKYKVGDIVRAVILHPFQLKYIISVFEISELINFEYSMIEYAKFGYGTTVPEDKILGLATENQIEAHLREIKRKQNAPLTESEIQYLEEVSLFINRKFSK